MRKYTNTQGFGIQLYENCLVAWATQESKQFFTITAGLSIKFEVGSRLEKSNRLYEQGAVGPLNLRESVGMLPTENFEIWKL